MPGPFGVRQTAIYLCLPTLQKDSVNSSHLSFRPISITTPGCQHRSTDFQFSLPATHRTDVTVRGSEETSP